MNKETTFVIPHQGRTEMLLKTIASIQQQSQYQWVKKIIVVTKNPEPIVFENTDKIEQIIAPQFLTISHQRNMGARASSSPYLAFLDADIELDSQWLETCHQLLEADSSRVMVSAMQLTPPKASGLERVRAALSNSVLEGNVQFMTGRNLLLSAQTYREVGGFPEHLQTCEDYYFTERVSKKGTLFYTSQTYYFHLGEDQDLAQTFTKERWRSAYNLLSLKGRNIPLSEWPSILLPFWFFLSSLVLILGLLKLSPGLFTLGFLGWLIPTGLYSFRLSHAFPLLSLQEIFKFYLAYFAGRTLGTLYGIPKLWLDHASPYKKSPSDKIKVMEFICPAGFYGAERWIIALAKGNKALESDTLNNPSLNKTVIEYHLAVTNETAHKLEVSEHFEALGLPSHEIALHHRFDLSAVKKLAQLIQDQEIDILHTHGYKSDIIGLLAARKAGIRAVCTPHGFENAKDWKLKLYLWLGGLSFRFFDCLSPLSNQIAIDLTTQYAVPSNKVHTIINGVDLSEVQEARTDLVAPTKGTFTIGYIGQLISRKNLSDMLKAFALFKEHCPEARLQLIGDGEEKPELTTLAKNLGILDQVEFLGFKHDRLSWLAHFDIFTMTSSLEGIPRCMMEAMAMGIPVCAFNIPGVDSLIEHGNTGLSCEFGDHKALANLWLELYQNPSQRQILSKHARDFVNAQFSAKRMARDYQQLFETICPQTSSANVLTEAAS